MILNHFFLLKLPPTVAFLLPLFFPFPLDASTSAFLIMALVASFSELLFIAKKLSIQDCGSTVALKAFCSSSMLLWI